MNLLLSIKIHKSFHVVQFQIHLGNHRDNYFVHPHKSLTETFLWGYQCCLKVLIQVVYISGSSVGAALTFPLCGYIIHWAGWPLVFYLSGALGTLWFVLWWLLVYDSPAEHPRISIEERDYIIKSIGSAISQKKVKALWKKLLYEGVRKKLGMVNLSNYFCSSTWWPSLIDSAPPYIMLDRRKRITLFMKYALAITYSASMYVC